MQHSPLTTIAAAVLLGVVGQACASLTRLPAIIFLLLLGVGAGPYGLELVRPDDLGAGLPTLVSAFVAIILFEGALTLRPAVLGQALAPVRRLITVGAATTLLGAAALAHFLMDLPWSLAFLFASLIVVTGPTVIAPILRRVRLLPRLHAVLKSESILIDPVGVFVAVAIYQYVVGLAKEEASWASVAVGFLARFGVGTLVGGVAGLLAAGLARLPLLHRSENEHLVNLGALGVALGAFAAAEGFQADSGIMAVIVAGLILAAAPLPFRDELEKFKEHVTTLGVSVLFILLSAGLNLPLLLRAGWREALLLAGLILVVRPAAVFLSTAGTGLTWREKAYLALIAPRGILAAAMSGYFAAQLRDHGLPGANRIELLVFFTIAATVCLQGGWAAALAWLLRVQPTRPEGVLLVGVNAWSLALAEELRAWGLTVLFVDVNPTACEAARREGFAVHQGDATDPATYRELDLSAVGLLIAMTPNDAVNTLACDAAGPALGGGALFQVIGKPVGAVPRSKVRMGGQWAMPTRRGHAEILELLRQGRLWLETEVCKEPTRVGPDLPTSQGLMVPLLVLVEGRLSVAVDGATCPRGAILLGLVGDEGEPLAEGREGVEPAVPAGSP